MEWLDAVLVLNGVYDVACALCIMRAPDAPLARLHLGVFKRRATRAANRLLAYWVCTYGADRIVAGVSSTAATDAIAALSYLVESAAYGFEARDAAHVHRAKACFVCVTSLALAGAVGWRAARRAAPAS
jgi:hypothetical protein